MTTRYVRLTFAFVIFCLCIGGRAQQTQPTPADPVSAAMANLSWRSIGPANMGGRISDVEGVPGNPNVVYVATGSGGIFKTVNGGMSWTPIFDRQSTISVGDIALEPGNPDVIWAGTGEGNPRNSVSFGDGVYRSTDGGKTWKHMGLRDSNTISKVIMHPRNPDIVYVAAIGHVWGPNEERGVFMTTDGGKTWQKTLYIDNLHGASDMEIDPQNPNILYAGMWRFDRKPWTFTSGSEKGGVFRSTDGGRTWNKMDKGLPKMIGRIGLGVAPSNPNVVYAMLEAKEGTLYRSDDKGENFRQVNRDQNLVSRGFYYTQVEVDPTDENRVYAVASLLFKSLDGGRNFTRIAPSIHIDFHALWIDPLNPKRMWNGQDGGVGVSYDEGRTWEYVNNFAAGQFYQIFADNAAPFYNISGGLQDNGTWVGPSRNREPSGIHNDDWRMISFGDGFFAIAHPDDPDLFLTESQGGNVVRTNMKNREQQLVVPFFGIGGAAENDKVRFNWNAPLVLSPHDKNTVYLAGSSVFRSTDFGKTWTAISDDLTTNNRERLKDAGGPVFTENTSAEYYGTIISLAESPVRRGMIWAGSDDGNLRVTTDGRTWAALERNVRGLPSDSAVSHVEPSRTNENTAYVAFDRHKMDDYKPYVFKTTDGGKSFTNISGNLPEKAYVHVVREDPKNTNLIYAGTELGIYATWDGGRNWRELNMKNFPRVAVHDIIVHPRENDLIVATHGRSIWVFDDASPIQQMNENILNETGHVFDIRPAYRYATRMTRYGVGDKIFRGQNPPGGAIISYLLKDKADEKTAVRMQVTDAGGKTVFEAKNLSKEKGINRTVWNLSFEGARARRPPTPEQLEFMGPPRGPSVLPGNYTVKIFVGDKLIGERRVEVRVDPTVQIAPADLQAQLDLAMKLRDMSSSMNDGLRLLDSAKTQIDQLEAVAKDRLAEMPADLTKSIGDYKKRLNDLLASLSTNPEDGIRAPSRFADQLGNLYFTIADGNSAPTPTMRENFEMLQKELPNKIAEISKFVDEDTARMNQALQRAGLGSIATGRKPELPK
jgi:photosystem II stability/assembly factor-like uncharacterized protein